MGGLGEKEEKELGGHTRMTIWLMRHMTKKSANHMAAMRCAARRSLSRAGYIDSVGDVAGGRGILGIFTERRSRYPDIVTSFFVRGTQTRSTRNKKFASQTVAQEGQKKKKVRFR